MTPNSTNGTAATHAPHGVICPLATPLTEAEQLDVPALRRLVDRLVPDLDGLLLLGSSAEYVLLTPSAAEEVVDVIIEQVAGRIPVYLGVGDTGTARVLANIERLVRPGISAVAVTSGFYYPAADQQSLLRHFRDISADAAVPVILYNIPQNTAGNLTADSVAELAQLPNVIGIKDSWGDFIQFQAYLNQTPDDFAVLQGREELTCAGRWMGSAGIVSALANLAPHLLRAALEAVDRGDAPAAREAQRAVDAAAAVFAQGHWLAVLKVAIAELGYGSGVTARPLPVLNSTQRDAVRGVLQKNSILPTSGART